MPGASGSLCFLPALSAGTPMAGAWSIKDTAFQNVLLAALARSTPHVRGLTCVALAGQGTALGCSPRCSPPDPPSLAHTPGSHSDTCASTRASPAAAHTVSTLGRCIAHCYVHVSSQHAD